MTEDSWDNYESGPFCQHWGDPVDCDTVCMCCTHQCHEHDWHNPWPCNAGNCECEAFKDAP
jgi:hypothetical protein